MQLGRKWVEIGGKGIEIVYFGTAETVLDDKYRVTVPRRFRETMEVLGHAVWFLTQGFDRSISLFPQAEWNQIRKQANQYSAMNARAQDFRRLLFASATEVRPDRQGRIPIPAHLRTYAGLERDAILIGVDDHLELWSRDAWSGFQQQHEPEFKGMAAQLFAGETIRDATEDGGASHGY